MRRSLVVAVAILMVGATALSVALSRVRNGPGLPGGETVVPVLEDPVRVLWDSAGIPHIFASSVEDAFAAQGMAHVQHRLWQMEFFRRVARGRLSEVLGESTVGSDRFLRTLGMHRVAARSAATLDDETRALLQAYVDGVNHAIETWSGPLPPEFLVLRFRPEPFTIEDVLAIERIMAWDLTQYDEDLTHAEALAELGPEAFERVRWRFPEGGTAIVDDTRGLDDRRGAEEGAVAADVTADITAATQADRRELLRSAMTPNGLGDIMRAVSATHASNAWVVGGDRTASGKPIVANDMHLGLNRPTLWYLAGLHAPGYDVVGMSIPGAPGIAVGRTRALAWGYTNSMLDDADFQFERVDPADTTRYLTPEGSEPFIVHTEVIEVSGRDEPETLVVRETRHGPVMSPVEARLDDELVSLQWVAHADTSLIPAIIEMNRAADADEFLEALQGFRTIHQNVVFADTAGTWGYWLGGRIPIRRTARPAMGPRPGWTGEADWLGFLPFDQHPHLLEPDRGYVVTANNRQQWDSIGGLVSNDMWFPPYRAESITRGVEGSSAHDVESIHAIQMGVVTLHAERFAAVAADGFEAAGASDLAALLRAWDGTASADRVEPSLFHAWHEGVRRALSRDVWGREGAFVHTSAVDRWIQAGLPAGTAERAAREAIDGVGAVPWGEQHYLHLDHPLAAVPILQRFFGFARSDIPIGGTSMTPNVAGFGTDADGRYRVAWGASQRHVSDLSEEVGWFVLPGGQSGYPGGPHSADQLPMWLEGGLMPLSLTEEGAVARTMKVWRLVPSG